MHSMLLGMLAETFIHPGTGKNEGAIDQRVAREAATQYPFIPGSGVKGAFRDYARARGAIDRDAAFGKADKAGRLIFGDARLLLLPVRSLSSAYRWVTCRQVVERFIRDLARGGAARRDVHEDAKLLSAIDLSAGDKTDRPWAIGGGGGTRLFLEERLLEIKGEPDQKLTELLAAAIADRHAAARLAAQLTVVSDDEFADLCSMALAVTARNKLNEDTKASENLWYEEALPPDTVAYCLVSSRDGQAGAMADMTKALDEQPYIQLGGNETVGQGWFKISRLGG